jgi:hypothetical protein
MHSRVCASRPTAPESARARTLDDIPTLFIARNSALGVTHRLITMMAATWHGPDN